MFDSSTAVEQKISSGIHTTQHKTLSTMSCKLHDGKQLQNDVSFLVYQRHKKQCKGRTHFATDVTPNKGHNHFIVFIS
jgi:hypothetical protein